MSQSSYLLNFNIEEYRNIPDGMIDLGFSYIPQYSSTQAQDRARLSCQFRPRCEFMISSPSFIRPSVRPSVLSEIVSHKDEQNWHHMAASSHRRCVGGTISILIRRTRRRTAIHLLKNWSRNGFLLHKQTKTGRSVTLFVGSFPHIRTQAPRADVALALVLRRLVRSPRQ